MLAISSILETTTLNFHQHIGTSPRSRRLIHYVLFVIWGKWSSTSWVTSCFLKFNCNLLLFFCCPVLAIGGTWFRLTASRMYALIMGKSKISLNNCMCCLVLNLLVHVYVLYIWSAKSTPPLFWLYTLTTNRHASSIIMLILFHL